MPQHTEAELRKRVREEVARRNRLARARDLRTVNNETTRARDEAPEPLITLPVERLELGRKTPRRKRR